MVAGIGFEATAFGVPGVTIVSTMKSMVPDLSEMNCLVWERSHVDAEYVFDFSGSHPDGDLGFLFRPSFGICLADDSHATEPKSAA